MTTVMPMSVPVVNSTPTYPLGLCRCIVNADDILGQPLLPLLIPEPNKITNPNKEEQFKMKTTTYEIKWNFQCNLCDETFNNGAGVDMTHLKFCSICIASPDAKKIISNEKRRQTLLKKKYNVDTIHTCGSRYCDMTNVYLSPVAGYYCLDCAHIDADTFVARAQDVLNDVLDEINQQRSAFFTPDTVVEVQANKRIEYIKADNVQSCFRADGQQVRVYWSTTDFKLHIDSDRRGDRLIKYANLIAMMKPLSNGVDGDVARVVKSFVRLKDMPTAIKSLRMQQLAAEGKIKPQQSNHANRNNGGGSVDPQWMQGYIAWHEDTIGRRPTGLEIRSGWLDQLAQQEAY